MSFETLRLRPEGHVLHVSFAAPPLNLMTRQMVMELFTVAGGLIEDSNTRVVVVDSAVEEFFIAHFDIADMIETVNETTPDEEATSPDVNALQGLSMTWQGLPQVTVAKVDGICRGGGLEFILALDMRFASSESRFALIEASTGIIPGGGGTTRILTTCGPARAMEILLTSRDFSGDEAERYGLINRALPADELDAYVDDAVGRLARRSQRIIGAHKDVAKAVFGGGVDSMFAGFRAENAGIRESLGREDVMAFMRNSAAEVQVPDNERDIPAYITRVTASDFPIA